MRLVKDGNSKIHPQKNFTFQFFLFFSLSDMYFWAPLWLSLGITNEKLFVKEKGIKENSANTFRDGRNLKLK